MGMTETILTQFKAREAEIKKEAAVLDAEMDAKRKAEERNHADILAKLETKRQRLAAMTAEYHELERTLTTEAIEDDELVKAGQATLAGVLAKKEREHKVHVEVTERLADSARIIRTLAIEIIGLEKQEAESRLNLHYCTSHSATTQIKKLKAEVETLERGVGCVLETYTAANYDRERAEGDLRLCEGRFISGMVWENLNLEELQAVRLDPRLHERFLPDLEAIIATAKPGRRYRLILRSGLQKGGGVSELTYREELPEGAPITTTTTIERKAGDK